MRKTGRKEESLPHTISKARHLGGVRGFCYVLTNVPFFV